MEERAFAHDRFIATTGAAQPVGKARVVEHRRIGVRPGIGRVDGRRQRTELGLDAIMVGALFGRHPVAANNAFDHVVAVLAARLDVARFDCQPKFASQAQISVLKLTGQLAAELNYPPVGERRLLNAAADAVTRFKYQYVAPGQC